MGAEVLDHNSVSKMSDLIGRNIGEKVIEDDMRAWRFWMAFLGFGYMHDSQAGAAGILLPNTAVFLRDIIESLKLKKKLEYRIDEFVDLVMPYARIVLHNAVDTKTFNYGFSNAIQYLTRWTENITCRLILTGRTIVQYPRRSVSLFSLIRKVQNSL